MANSPTEPSSDQEDLKDVLFAAMGDAAADWLADLEDDDDDLQAMPSTTDMTVEDAATADVPGAKALDAVLDQLTAQLNDVSAPQTDADGPSQQETNTDVDPGLRHAVFEVGDQLFGIPLSGVREIDRCGRVTTLPRTPEWLRGVTNLRGQILSVTDFRRLLNLPDDRVSASEKIIVVHSERHNAHTALVVDRVLGIRNLSGERGPLGGLSDRLAKFADSISVTDQATTVLIDPDELLGCDELKAFATQ